LGLGGEGEGYSRKNIKHGEGGEGGKG